MNIRPPILSRASRRVTERPWPANFEDAASPAAPAPITITSGLLDINKTGGTGRRFIIHDIQMLEAKLRSDRDFQIVVTTIIEVHFISVPRLSGSKIDVTQYKERGEDPDQHCNFAKLAGGDFHYSVRNQSKA